MLLVAFFAYMMVISRKEGVASIIMAYSFFAFATLHVIYVICKVSRSKFVVTDRTITRYFPFASPKIYCMDEISKVVIRVDKYGHRSYRIYRGKEKMFELTDGMVNLGRFLEALQESQVTFV